MQEFSYKLIEDGTYCVTGYKGDEAEVVIPATFNVTVLFDKLFAGHKEITSVKIPETVTDLGEFVFDGCENLRHIELPKKLNCMWGFTFARCGLEEITLSDNIKWLPSFVFKDCKNLKKVVCGKNMKEICSWAFAGCTSLEKVEHDKDVKVSPQAYKTVELKPWQKS